MIEQNRQQRDLFESERSFRLLVEGVADYALFMLDPTDPMFYLTLPVKGFSLAVSPHGMIPYVPVHAPASFGGEKLVDFFGEVYATFSFSFPVLGIPLSLDAGMTFNLDANRDGVPLGGKGL